MGNLLDTGGSIAESPLDYVIRHGWDYKIYGDQINVKGCPLCGNEKWHHFYINKYTGLWDCKVCGEHGNLQTLKQKLKEIIPVFSAIEHPQAKELGETEFKKVMNFHTALLASSKRLDELLNKWGISIDTVKKCRLGIAEGYSVKNNQNILWITIPHLIENRLYDIKYRAWFGFKKDFKKVKDATPILYNQEVLSKCKYSIILSEGERDAITLIDRGCSNVVGTTGGAGTFKKEWWESLQHIQKIYIAYDSDDAGRKGAKTIASRLGIHRCYNVVLPEGMDVSDYLATHTYKEFVKLVKKSKLFDIDYVISIKDVFKQAILSSDSEIKHSTGYKSIDRILNGGFRQPDLVTLSAPAKSLKTTLAFDMAVYHALHDKKPVLFLCMEMSQEKLARLLISKAYHVDRDKDIDKNMLYKAYNELGHMELYLGHFTKVTFNQVCETIREAYKRYGTQYVVFDNIHFLARGLQSKVEAIEDMMKGFVELKNEIKATLIVIAQPKKINVNKEMDYFDIGWSGAFASDSDTIMILHRKRSKSYDASFLPYLLVKVDAGRYTPGGRTILKSKENLPTFEEISLEEMEYALKLLYGKESSNMDMEK